MNPEFIAQIEAYLEGQISREALEKMAAEQGVQNLDQEIQWLKDSQLAIEATGLKDQLDDLLPKAKMKETPVRRLRVLRPALAVAASIAVLIIAYFGWMRPRQSDLYAQYEYVDPGLPVLMSQSDDHLLYDALTYFGEENYAVAEAKLTGIREQYSDNDTLLYYLGASQLYQGKTTEAATFLQQVTEQEGSAFQEQAEWLLVLASLREKDPAGARQHLQPILANPDHRFFAEASQLQQTLVQ